ncbi:MAG: metallophosphoesterase [Candidatus Omnitrophica bacterium]|nr:metallophosphoesterase [Candidatus Omnitrophota bacterium]
MKIGVISDTHIPDGAEVIPEKIINEFKKVDMIIHAGDLVDLKVLEQLKNLCKDVRAVWGNMDPQTVRKYLPEKQIIEVGKHRIGLMHGYGAPVNLIEILTKSFKNDKVDVIIFGHSHAPVNEKKQDILFFNPGSATDKIFAKFNSFGILEINDGITAKIIKI